MLYTSLRFILNTIIASFIDEYKQILHDSQVQGTEKISVYIEYLKQNKNCPKIMISESLKTGNNQNLLFKAHTPLMEMDTAQPSNQELDNADWITELFTSIIPSVLTFIEGGSYNFFLYRQS